MKNSYALILLAVSCLFLASCSMEKRLYNKGFHVQWNKKYKTKSTNEVEKQALASTPSEPLEIAKLETQKAPLTSFQTTQDESFETMNSSQDAISTDEYNVSEANEDIRNGSAVTYVADEQEVAEYSDNETSIVHSKKNKKQKNSSSDSSTGGKSQVVALVLVLLVGVLGVHRFYLGYTGIGVLMLLTLGCCGILALIDLIRICTGDLKPADGEYTETL